MHFHGARDHLYECFLVDFARAISQLAVIIPTRGPHTAILLYHHAVVAPKRQLAKAYEHQRIGQLDFYDNNDGFGNSCHVRDSAWHCRVRRGNGAKTKKYRCAGACIDFVVPPKNSAAKNIELGDTCLCSARGSDGRGRGYIGAGLHGRSNLAGRDSRGSFGMT